MSQVHAEEIPPVLWRPHGGPTAIEDFQCFVHERTGTLFSDYAALHAWSTGEPNAFWMLAAEFLGVLFHDRSTHAVADASMPGAKWFPGATLNYAEHALDYPRDPNDVVLIFAREDGLRRYVTHFELRDLVGRARVGLQRHGVRNGDRVVALAPNCVETLVMFLASASLGAIWSSCSPEFGAKAVTDRFEQLEPALLLAVDGYWYGGRGIDIRGTVDALRSSMPSLRATVLLPYLDLTATMQGTEDWSDFVAQDGPLEFEPVPFDHPLWVLFSSGTTGLPKGIVQGHGGIVLEHMKMLRLQHDLRVGDRILWFTTTGWMMWNYLVSGLTVGATVVLFDGSPGIPDLGALWGLVAEERIRVFGTSAPYIHACMKACIEPAAQYDLSALESIGSTGAPLSPEGFTWITDHVGDRVQVASVSGGTDVCTAFLCAAPTVPVWRGELSCAALGADVRAFDESGNDILDAVGELVLTKPMPSMPVSFWNDPDGSRMHAAYFDLYPGTWRHGDWVRRTPRGSYVIYGRSDSTLNRGGVRMGTADFYAVVESFPSIVDSIVVDTSRLGDSNPGEMLCFVVLAEGAALDAELPALRSALRTQLSPRHVPDRFIAVGAVPRTVNGKKCEVPVKRILAGADPGSVVSRDTLAVPSSLDFFVEFARNAQEAARTLGTGARARSDSSSLHEHPAP